MGYKNPTITLPFPELAEDGDHIEVVIRNPRLLPAGELRSMAGNRTSADRERLAAARAAVQAGGDIPDDLMTEEDADRGFEFVAKLVVGWHVYDATVPDGDLLPLPATAELIAKLPQDILTAIMEKVTLANPPRTPAAGTGKTS